eukprot:g11331.t1
MSRRVEQGPRRRRRLERLRLVWRFGMLLLARRGAKLWYVLASIVWLDFHRVVLNSLLLNYALFDFCLTEGKTDFTAACRRLPLIVLAKLLLVEAATSPLSTGSPHNRSSPQLVTATGMEDLPDLTDRIMSMGLYEEYQKFREGNLIWRGGGHHGARGEPTAQALDRSPERQQRSFLNTFYPSFDTLSEALSIWPALFGGVFFSFGAYLMCLESMNVMRGRDTWKTNLFNLPSALAYLDSCNELNPEVGTSLYPVALVANLWTHLEPTSNLLLSTIPYTIGGIFFVVAGFLECLENKVFTTSAAEGSAIPKCAAAMNFMGGILFALGPPLSQVILWKDEQFGLAYLAALNHMSGQDRARSWIGGQQSGAFSVRGIVFIHLYCVVSVVAVMNFCLSLNHFLSSPNLFTMTRAAEEFLPFVLLHLVLLMHSAVVKTPKTQPFHALVMSLRFITVVIMLLALGTFIAGLMHPPPPPMIERHSLHCTSNRAERLGRPVQAVAPHEDRQPAEDCLHLDLDGTWNFWLLEKADDALVDGWRREGVEPKVIDARVEMAGSGKDDCKVKVLRETRVRTESADTHVIISLLTKYTGYLFRVSTQIYDNRAIVIGLGVGGSMVLSFIIVMGFAFCVQCILLPRCDSDTSNMES